jgi:photosystem II stability/assembly factor-like uncharacterized protein
LGALAVHPTNPDIVFATGKAAVNAGDEKLAVLKSSNGGATWTSAKLDVVCD